MANDSRPLLNLPQELIVRIASHLTTPELGPFRRSCKQIEKYLFNAFAKEFFSKRQFMIEHESLEVLVSIANHPSLASFLREVIIGTEMFSFEQDYPTAHSTLLETRFKRNLLSRNVLLATGQAKAMLVEAFSKLPNLCAVGLRDFSGRNRYRDGRHARWRSWGHSLLGGISNTSPQAIFPLIMMALSEANARPIRMEVFLRRRGEQLNAESFAFVPGMKQVLEKMSTVMLSISTSSFETHLGTTRDANLYQAPIRGFLARLKNVEHLRLNFGISQYMATPLLEWLGAGKDDTTHQRNSPIANMVETPTLEHLTTLEIGIAALTGRTIIKVLARFQHSLRSISLHKIYLRPDNGGRPTEELWPTFLSDLSEALPMNQLQSIMIGLVMQDMPASSGSLVPYRPVSFAPKGTPANKKAAATCEDTIKYQAQYTSETASEWLKSVAQLVYIQHEEESSFGESDLDEDSDLEMVDFDFPIDGDLSEDEDEDEDEDVLDHH